MVFDPKSLDPNKPGLLALGYKPGQSTPMLDDVNIPNRVGDRGEVEWRFRDKAFAMMDANYDRDPYRSRKHYQVLQAIFRGFDLLEEATLGLPFYSYIGEWALEPLRFGSRIFWESAPIQIQEIVFKGARKLVEEQLKEFISRNSDQSGSASV